MPVLVSGLSYIAAGGGSYMPVLVVGREFDIHTQSDSLSPLSPRSCLSSD